MNKNLEIDTSFEVMIKTCLPREVLFDQILAALPNSAKRGGYILYRDNVLDLDANPLYDEIKSSLSEDAWMFYPLKMNVFPQSACLSPAGEHQIVLARDLIGVLRSFDCHVELVAEFEI